MTRAFTCFCYFTIAALGLMAVLDLLFFMAGGVSQTLSYRFWVLSKQWPLVPYALGFVTAHLVWQYDPDAIGEKK